LRQPARSTSAQQKPVALLFVHPAFVVLIKAVDLIQNKREATNAKRKTRAMLYCCCFPLRTRLSALIQNQSFAQRATISNTLVLLSGVWGTPHLKQARSTSAKRKNISDALPLLFFCFASNNAQATSA
jgi:hypothetical protein